MKKPVKNHFRKRHMSNVMHSITSIQNTEFLVEAQHSKDRMWKAIFTCEVRLLF